MLILSTESFLIGDYPQSLLLETSTMRWLLTRNFPLIQSRSQWLMQIISVRLVLLRICHLTNNTSTYLRSSICCPIPNLHPVRYRTLFTLVDPLASIKHIFPVLRMLSCYVGEEKFLKGVSLYLKQHLFSNTVTRDLWDGISTVTGLDIVDLMENWITKIGYPVLSVTEDAIGIKVRQDRFLETGPADSKDNETIWSVRLGDKRNGC